MSTMIMFVVKLQSARSCIHKQRCHSTHDVMVSLGSFRIEPKVHVARINFTDSECPT